MAPPIIWGLDFKEVQWYKLGPKELWRTDYYLRREKVIWYSIAMISYIVSESLSTDQLDGTSPPSIAGHRGS